ncbi:MAG: heme exporter protein CcmB [Nitrospirae bacterium]|nr:heme exporter protein CcmB [Nitrospirota bacterium]
MNFFNVIRWLAWKDLISEMRSRENISSMFFFALIVILIFSFSFSMDQKTAQELMPGIMWVAFIFTGIIGLGKSFTAELQNDCLENLQMNPIPRGAIYLGKLVSNLLFMLVVEVDDGPDPRPGSDASDPASTVDRSGHHRGGGSHGWRSAGRIGHALPAVDRAADHF